MTAPIEPGKFLVIDKPAEILTFLRDLPVGSFPGGTLIVPCDLARQGLRRIAGDNAVQALTGWRMLTSAEAALEVLHGSGIPAQAMSGGTRAATIEAMLAVRREDGFGPGALDWMQESESMQEKLGYFGLDQLRSGAGYPTALACTIDELASAGCNAGSLLNTPLDGTAKIRARDLGTIWSSLRHVASCKSDDRRVAAAAHETGGALFGHAVAVAKESWLAAGALVIWLDDPTEAELEFVSALPASLVVVQRKRPVRAEFVDLLKRIERRFGDSGLLDAVQRPSTSGGPREIDILQAKLFDSPQGVPNETRPAEPDGSVHLELHACVEDELQAAVDWVACEVLEHGTPLEQTAVLFPATDPLAGMFVERLNALRWPGAGSVPAYVAGGLPASNWSMGCRIDCVLDAVESGLSAESLRQALPCLVQISSARAGEVVYSCGATGGTPGNRAAGLAWVDALASREQMLAVQLGEMTRVATGNDAESGRRVRGLRQTRRLYEGIGNVLPIVRAMHGVLQLAINEESLADLWRELRELLVSVHQSPGEPPVLERLNEALTPLVAMPSMAALRGFAAIRALRRMLGDLRIQNGRLGEPRVFVGSIADAGWLSFRAVRICGLCEGAVPPSPREDAVLPDLERDRLRESTGLPIEMAGHAVLRQLQAFRQAVRSARERLVLSAPREWIDGSEREPSAVLLEVTNTLGRQGVATGTKMLHQFYFVPGGRELQEFRDRTTLTSACQHARVARQTDQLARIVPSAWLSAGVQDLTAMRDRQQIAAAALTLNGPAPVVLPGTAPDHPLSAYRLGRLVGCPARFVMQDVLYWDERFEPPSMDEIDPMPYGTLLHRVMERFYEKHGRQFRAGPAARTDWLDLALAMARQEMDEFLKEYPVLGEATRGSQLQRLMHDVRTLIAFDLSRPASEFVKAEHGFGDTDGLALSLDGGRVLYMAGYVDRIEKTADETQIWDIKSGRLSQKDPIAPDPDLQLAIYLRAVDANHEMLGIPPVGSVAYVSPQDKGSRMRLIEGAQLSELMRQSGRWLNVAVDLLREGLFPYAFDKNACKFCPFKVLCGDDICEASARQLEDLPDGSGGRRFLELAAGGDQ